MLRFFLKKSYEYTNNRIYLGTYVLYYLVFTRLILFIVDTLIDLLIYPFLYELTLLNQSSSQQVSS